MMKLFISQPMRDKSDELIKYERIKAIHWVRAHVPVEDGEEVEVIDSFFEGAPAKATPLWYLGESIKLLGEADVVYFCKDWEKYNGCTIEHECAVRYGKQCIYA